MDEVATTRMSSKGQVVIPEEIREALGLQAGAQFVVVGEGDAVILKRIHKPSIREFKGLLSKARKQTRRAGLSRDEVGKSIKRSRGRRNR